MAYPLPAMANRLEMPFLYQTRTILRLAHRIPASRTRRCLSTQSSDGSRETNIPSSTSSLSSWAPFRSKKESSREATPKITSTITRSERKAFEAVLRFTPDELSQADAEKSSSLTDAHDVDIENILEIFTSSIQSDEPPQEFSGNLAPEDEPPLVGRADHSQDPVTAQLVTRSISDAQSPTGTRHSVDSRLYEKALKIAKALRAAASSKTLRGDVAMWEVVETQISSMPAHFPQQKIHRPLTDTTHPFQSDKITFSGSGKKAASASRIAKTTTTDESQTPPTSATSNLTTPLNDSESTSASLSQFPSQGENDMQTLQVLYPAMLLLALRLYINHFPTSPYPFLLLPRIRSLGTRSYVLGASAEFYNSLIYLTWTVRSSLRDVDALLGEMERGGVEMGEGTYAVLRQIEMERSDDLGNVAKTQTKREGPFTSMVPEKRPASTTTASRGASWWWRQEQTLWFPKILDWLDVVSGRIAAQKIRGVA